MSGRRKSYDREFKMSTVRLILRGEKSMKEVAEDMGLNYYMLAEWKKEYEQKGEEAFPGNGKNVYSTEAEREIAELKKQLRQAEMERDILKKAMAISLKER